MPVVQYDWDEIEDNIDEEFDENLASTAEYTTEPELYGNVASQLRDGVTSTFHHDGLGSTIAVTNDAAVVTDTLAYAAFGSVTWRTGTTDVYLHFQGQAGYYWDKVTSSYSIRQRSYDPTSARWLSADPLWLNSLLRNAPRLRDYSRTVAVYLYANNNPIIFVDPSGLQSECQGDEQRKYDKCDYVAPTPLSCQNNPAKSTEVAICARPLRQAPIGCHVYLKIDCSEAIGETYSFGASQSGICEKCKDSVKDVGQLRFYSGHFSKDEIPPNPDFPRDPDKPLSHICEYYTVLRPPKDVFGCMSEVARRIRNACIQYDYLAAGKPEKACNSNCAAWWMASLCFTPVKDGKKLDLPKDRPAACVGWGKEIPDIIKKEE